MAAPVTMSTETTRSVAATAVDGLGGHQPVQAEQAGVPAQNETEGPGEQGELIEDHPHQGERGNRAAAKMPASAHPKSRGRSGVPMRRGDRRCTGGASAGGRGRQRGHRSTPAPLRDLRHDGRGGQVDGQGHGEENQAGRSRAWVPRRPPLPKWMAIRAWRQSSRPAWRMWGEISKLSTEDDDHGNGLAQGPAQPQHHGADHAATAEGQDHPPDHRRPGRPQGERPLLLARRREGEHLAASSRR